MEDRFPAGTYRVILGMSRVENYSIKRRPAFAETPGAAEDPEIARIRSTLLADVSAEAPGERHVRATIRCPAGHGHAARIAGRPGRPRCLCRYARPRR